MAAVAGLAIISLASGCQEQSVTETAAPTPAATAAAEHGHEHAEGEGEHGNGHGAGPHEGTLADWGGGKYHVEFTVDHDKQEATVYVLGSDEKSPAPIKTDKVLLSIGDPELMAELLPVPLEGETDGLSSRFVGKHENLGIVQEYAGTMSAEIEGTPYTGDFKESADGHEHGHTHGADDALVWEGELKEHAGLTIRLGHHGKQLHAGEEVEPAVSIERDGVAVADAKVFNSLVTPNGKTVLAEEVPTVYEPATAAEPAHYAQGALAIPGDATAVALRFRIIPADGAEVTYDVPVSAVPVDPAQ